VRAGGRIALSAYVGAALLAIVAGGLALEVWRADLRVPFAYGGDALLFALPVKSVVDHAWYLQNPSLGAPGGLQLFDYPFAAHNAFHLFLIKVMALFSGDWALLFNLYFLLGFPLIALSALAVLRQFRVGYGPAVVVSVLYAVLPSRLLKGESHLFLDVFFQVPLEILVLLWACGSDPPLTRDRPGRRWPALDLRRPRSLAALAICFLAAGTELYYAFFVAALLIAGGVWSAIERRSTRNLVAGLALAGIIATGLGVVGLPTLIHRARHGANEEVAVRNPGEAELHGMKIAQLLLPVDGHRLPALRKLKQSYNNSAPLLGENSTTSLGLIGALGFLALLVVVIGGRRPSRPREDVLRPLAVLNFMAVLLATLGGFGSLFALLVTPQIRGYARMNVIVAFFSLFAVALLLERLRDRHARLAAGLLPVLLVVGVFDQASLDARPGYAATKQVYDEEARFVRAVEASVPAGAVVFELPYMSFPEMPGLGRLETYDGLRPYLHSRALRWSFPAMRGRAGDAWARVLAQAEPKAMVEGLLAAEVRGILIQRGGYKDEGTEIEAALRALGIGEPIVSADNQLAFYDLGPLANRPGWTRPSPLQRELMLQPVAVQWGTGFSTLESDEDGTFRWGAAYAGARLENDRAEDRVVVLKMKLAAAQPPAILYIRGDLLSATIEIPTTGTVFERELTVPHGHHAVRFHCDGRPAFAPGDRRTLVWRIENFELTERLPDASTDRR
jgi:phosphoglycerol transferase